MSVSAHPASPARGTEERREGRDRGGGAGVVGMDIKPPCHQWGVVVSRTTVFDTDKCHFNILYLKF